MYADKSSTEFSKPISKGFGLILIIVAAFCFLFSFASNAIQSLIVGTLARITGPIIISLLNIVFNIIGSLDAIAVIIVAFILLSQGKKRTAAGIPSTWCKISGFALILIGASFLIANINSTLQVSLMTQLYQMGWKSIDVRNISAVLSILANSFAAILSIGSCIAQFIAFSKANKEAKPVAIFLLISALGLVTVVIANIYYLFLHGFVTDALLRSSGANPSAISSPLTIIAAAWGLLALVFYFGTAMSLITKPQK